MYHSGRILSNLQKLTAERYTSFSYYTSAMKSVVGTVNSDIVCQGRNRSDLFSRYSGLTYHKNTQADQQKYITQNRFYSSGSRDSDKKGFDSNKFLYATYLSFGMGGLLLLAAIYRGVNKYINKLQGVEEVADSVFGSRPMMIKYKEVVLPIFTSKILKDIESFEVREDDVWVVSYPRSGTTWVQEIVYLIQTNLDFQTAKEVSIENRFPYLEYHYPGLKVINEMKSPRLIKTHLPLTLLPEEIKQKNPKIIYIARNPKDVLISYFHFMRMLKPVSRFNGSFEDFYHKFLHNKLCYSPWWKHVKDFWDNKNQQNILFIRYEDMQKDVHSVIKKIADFLGKSLSGNDVCKIAEHCQFNKMKNNEMVNFSWWKELGLIDAKSNSEFIRKGVTGDWKGQLTEEMNKRIDRMVILKFYGSGLEFQYQIDEGDSKSTDTNVSTRES